MVNIRIFISRFVSISPLRRIIISKSQTSYLKTSQIQKFVTKLHKIINFLRQTQTINVWKAVKK